MILTVDRSNMHQSTATVHQTTGQLANGKMLTRWQAADHNSQLKRWCVTSISRTVTFISSARRCRCLASSQSKDRLNANCAKILYTTHNTESRSYSTCHKATRPNKKLKISVTGNSSMHYGTHNTCTAGRTKWKLSTTTRTRQAEKKDRVVTEHHFCVYADKH